MKEGLQGLRYGLVVLAGGVLVHTLRPVAVLGVVPELLLKAVEQALAGEQPDATE